MMAPKFSTVPSRKTSALAGFLPARMSISSVGRITVLFKSTASGAPIGAICSLMFGARSGRPTFTVPLLMTATSPA